jgi:hypothetical protein
MRCPPIFVFVILVLLIPSGTRSFENVTLPSWNWSRALGFAGWRIDNGIPLQPPGPYPLEVEATSDLSFVAPIVRVPATAARAVRLTIRARAAVVADLFWTADGKAGAHRFLLSGGSEWRSYTEPLAACDGWTGTISRVGLRLVNVGRNQVELAAFALLPTANELPDPEVFAPANPLQPLGWAGSTGGWVASIHSLRPNAAYRLEGIQELRFSDADGNAIPAVRSDPVRVPWGAATAHAHVRNLADARLASITPAGPAAPWLPEHRTDPALPLPQSDPPSRAGYPGRDLPRTRLVHTRGGPVLDIDGYRTPPHMYVPPYEISGDPEPYVEHIRGFAAQGIHLHSANIRIDDKSWRGQGDYDFSALDRTFGTILRVDSQARLLLRVELDAPDWWAKANPTELRLNEKRSRDTLHPVWERQSLGSEVWQRDARDCLLALARFVRGRPYSPRVWGVLFCTSGAIEWVENTNPFNQVDYSQASERGWRKWLRMHYATDEELRRAWNSPAARLETAPIPPGTLRNAAEYGDFRDPTRGAAPAIDYSRYVTDRILDLMLDGARALKEGSGERLVVGVYYGYHLAGSAIYGFLHEAGHSGFGRALRSPDLTFFVSPAGYHTRFPGMAGMPMSPADACEQHGKLWIQEEDLRTYLDANEFEYDHGRVDTYYDSVQVLRRDFGEAVCSGWGLWWYEMNAVWFRDPGLRAEIGRMRMAQKRPADGAATPRAQVAVVLDEASFPYLRNYRGDTPQRVAIHDQIDQLYRIGASFDLVLLSDLLEGGKARSYRLYVFLNPWKVIPEARTALHARLKRDGATAVWEWGAGLFSGDRTAPSVESASALTGFRLRAQDTAAAGPPRRLARLAMHPLTRGLTPEQFGSPAPQATLLTPQDGTPLAWIAGLGDTGVGLAVKQQNGWRSVYLSTPGLPAGFLRHLAEERNIPIYSVTDDVLDAGHGFLMLHADRAGTKILTFPRNVEVWDALQNLRLASRSRTFEYLSAAGETRIFALR